MGCCIFYDLSRVERILLLDFRIKSVAVKIDWQEIFSNVVGNLHRFSQFYFYHSCYCLYVKVMISHDDVYFMSEWYRAVQFRLICLLFRL